MADLSWRQRLRWSWVLLALAVALVLALLWKWRLGPEVALDRVLQRDLVQTVVASGRVEAPNRVDVGVQVTGTVARIPVAEGQTVKAGDVLIELESSELRAAERQALVAVDQARARLRQLREVQAPLAEQSVRQARASLDNATTQLQRNESLFKQGFIGAAALDESRKAVELADAQWRSAQAQLQSARAGGSDVAVAETAVAQAVASAEMATARSRYGVVRAVAAGTLISRNVEVGDVVQAGKVLMTLSPTGRTQLVADIDEKNLRLLALGQKALASADAYPNERFAAVLAYINPAVNAQTGAVPIKFDVPQPPATLRQDMTVSVDVEVARRPQALVAPLAAIHDPDSAQPWALRVENGRAVRVPVRVGLRSGGLCEVLQGLSAGDELVPVSASVTEGGSVRPLRAASAAR